MLYSNDQPYAYVASGLAILSARVHANGAFHDTFPMYLRLGWSYPSRRTNVALSAPHKILEHTRSTALFLPVLFQDVRDREDASAPCIAGSGGQDARLARPHRCRVAFDYVFQPLSGKIASTFLGLSAAFFIAATAIDDARRATLGLCYGFAALSLLIALVAASFFAKKRMSEGRSQISGNGAVQVGSSPPFA